MAHDERGLRVPRWLLRCRLPFRVSPELLLAVGVINILEPAILDPHPRRYRRVIVILVLVLAVIVAARAPMPTLPDLPPLQLLVG